MSIIITLSISATITEIITTSISASIIIPIITDIISINIIIARTKKIKKISMKFITSKKLIITFTKKKIILRRKITLAKRKY
jgi:hypothetical protein